MLSKPLSRRKFLQVAAGVTGTLALAACAPAALPSGGAGESAAPGEESVTLTFGRHWEAAFRPRQDEFDNAYKERHPNVTIDITYNTWGDHNTVVPTWAAANTLPDIIYVHGSRAFPWSFEGIITNIQDLVDADEEFNVEGIWEESLRLYRFRGDLHGIPYDHGPLVLGYNQDIFDEAGMDYPDESWTLEDLREAARALTNLEGDQPVWGWAGEMPRLANNTGYVQCLHTFGADLLNEEETEVILDSDAARQALQFWVDMILVDQSAPTPAESQAFEQGPWISGRVAMDDVASWNTPTLAEFAPFTWDVAPFPSGPEGRFTSAFGSGYGITRDSSVREAAWDYLSEYLSVEGMEFMWGQTGRGSPARAEAYDSWMNSPVAPEHAEVFLDALNNYAITGRPYETLAAAEFNDICNRQDTLLRSGETTVDDAIAAVVSEGNQVLQAAAERFREKYP